MPTYRDLKSYQSATLIYDLTVEFCDRYVKPDRTNQTNRSNRMVDQMVQAARSGKQNIAEGAKERASGEMEIKLTSVARASFEELLADYEDFLRQRGFLRWGKDDPRALAVRALAYQGKSDKSDLSDKSYRTSYESYLSYFSNPEAGANALVCLINQCNFLLDRQIKYLESQFIKKESWDDKMKKKRKDEEKRRIWNNWASRW